MEGEKGEGDEGCSAVGSGGEGPREAASPYGEGVELVEAANTFLNSKSYRLTILPSAVSNSKGEAAEGRGELSEESLE